MIKKIMFITLLVNNQDEAIKFYTQKLGFVVKMDLVSQNDGLRWVTVALPEQQGSDITMLLPTNDYEKSIVGKQSGKYPLFVMQTKDIYKEYEKLRSNGIKFLGQPEKAAWGTGVVFEDLYGNKIYLRD
jgi:catechol 2,3-dioxygenase-like lactoylglutathione lyase family enzyme